MILEGGTAYLLSLLSHANKVRLVILHAKFQHYANKNFQMSKLGLEKEKELEIKLSTFEKAKEFQEKKKKTISVSWTGLKPLTLAKVMTNRGKCLER